MKTRADGGTGKRPYQVPRPPPGVVRDRRRFLFTITPPPTPQIRILPLSPASAAPLPAGNAYGSFPVRRAREGSGKGEKEEEKNQ